MTTRRDFLGRLALGAAGLWLAPDALELITEPRRKYWAGHSFPPDFARAGDQLRFVGGPAHGSLYGVAYPLDTVGVLVFTESGQTTVAKYEVRGSQLIYRKTWPTASSWATVRTDAR